MKTPPLKPSSTIEADTKLVRTVRYVDPPESVSAARQAAVETEKRLKRPVSSAPGDDRIHRDLRATERALRSAERRGQEFCKVEGEGLAYCDTPRWNIDRALAILDALLKASEARGIKPDRKDNPLRLILGDVPFTPVLRPVTRRTEISKTPINQFGKRFESSPTERFSLTIYGGGYSRPGSSYYMDRSGKPLESYFPDLFIWMAEKAEELRIERQEREVEEISRINAEIQEREHKFAKEFASDVASRIRDREVLLMAREHLSTIHQTEALTEVLRMLNGAINEASESLQTAALDERAARMTYYIGRSRR